MIFQRIESEDLAHFSYIIKDGRAVIVGPLRQVTQTSSIEQRMRGKA